MDPVESNICALCDRDFQRSGLRGVLPCGHQFHANCIRHVRERVPSDRCPTCNPVSRFDVIKLQYPPEIRLTETQRHRQQEIRYDPLPRCGLCECLISESRHRTHARLSSDCGHVFCVRCIRSWTNSQREDNIPFSCPLCRAPYNGEIRIIYPDNMRRTRSMAASEGAAIPLDLDLPMPPLEHPPQDPQFNRRNIPPPPMYEAQPQQWLQWYDRYGREAWFDWLADHAYCQACGLANETRMDRLNRCQMCGRFWHNSCGGEPAPGDWVLPGPEVHPHPDDDEHLVWACAECRGPAPPPPPPHHHQEDDLFDHDLNPDDEANWHLQL